ncbi:GreA/GreB family elongation factor [Novipirellula caenicola]|uniref:GreA/GreB family elongation factor n=1 Tax=Novipirellula caenicola TaxID=1536901 RepID=UPI0031E83860
MTRSDALRLKTLLNSEFVIAIGGERTHLSEFKDRLERAMVLESQDIMSDVITMNSTVRMLDLDLNESETYTLVYPEEACISEGKLSILSPLGTMIFGCRVGEDVTCRVPGRVNRKRIEKITFQPERVGAFNL